MRTLVLSRVRPGTGHILHVFTIPKSAAASHGIEKLTVGRCWSSQALSIMVAALIATILEGSPALKFTDLLTFGNLIVTLT